MIQKQRFITLVVFFCLGACLSTIAWSLYKWGVTLIPKEKLMLGWGMAYGVVSFAVWQRYKQFIKIGSTTDADNAEWDTAYHRTLTAIRWQSALLGVCVMMLVTVSK